MTNLVDILLPTYNGEKFLPDQIESLLNQTFTEWRLIIRDDLSSDGTMKVINKYEKKYPDKIFLLDSKFVKKGIVGSFEHLIEVSSAPYIAFCDQDDVWNPDKLEIQFKKMIELELVYGDKKPILIHTDLAVVDENMETLNDSFWRYQNLSPDRMSSLRRVLVQNSVTGCTVLINRELLKRSLPIPDKVIMHDWWLALVAVAEGKIYGMDVSTVKYRQHGGNDTGAKKWSVQYKIRAIFSGSKCHKRKLLKTCNQARALLNSNVLGPCNKNIVERYVSMYQMRWVKRRLEMIKMGFYKHGLLRSLAMFIYL